MRYFLISLLVAGCAWGQVTVQTNRLGALTKNSMIVTGMTFNAGQVTGIPHETNATAHASLFGETVKTNDATYLATVASASTAWQNPASATNWTWTTDGHEITLTGYNFISMDVVIPDMLDGLPVTRIGGRYEEGTGYVGALQNSPVTSVSAGPGLREIGEQAFRNCKSLEHVDLCGVETIGPYSFDNCVSLKTIFLPRLLTVQFGAFCFCSGLEEATFPSLTNLETTAFFSCSNLVSVSIPHVEVIGDVTFMNCTSLPAVDLFNIKKIGVKAFAGCMNLRGIYYGGRAAPVLDELWGVSAPFFGIPEGQVTNYVSNPASTGWSDTFGDMPVVRMGVEADSVTLGGVIRTAWPEVPSVWQQMTWGSPQKTNAAYRMYWDATNGTFAVEDILP